MHTTKMVPGGVRLSDAEARKRFLNDPSRRAAVVHHDVNIGAHALRETQRLTGKRDPVYKTVQTVGCAPGKKFTPR